MSNQKTAASAHTPGERMARECEPLRVLISWAEQLAVEVDGAWRVFEPALRQDISNTNYAIIADRLRSFQTALAAYRSAPHTPAMKMMPGDDPSPYDWEDHATEPAAAGVAVAAAAARVLRLEDGLQKIDSWSRAYPLQAFPEPDLARVAEVLKAAGMSLDAMSAHAMRHVVEGVGKIARAALGDGEG